MRRNNHSVSLRQYALRVALVILMGGLTSMSAWANSTCTTLVNSIHDTLNRDGGDYTFEMTMHRTGVALVTYSSGYVYKSGNSYWPLTGWSNQLFSDRYTGNQRFNANAADTLTPWFSVNGDLYIYYNTWHFSTQWDMSCQGNVMTQYIPGHGVVTVTFRDHQPPIQ